MRLLLVIFSIGIGLFMLIAIPAAQTLPKSYVKELSEKPAVSDSETQTTQDKNQKVKALLGRLDESSLVSRNTYPTIYQKYIAPKDTDSNTLSASLSPNSSPGITDGAVDQPETTPAPDTPVQIGDIKDNPVKRTITIAILGDSMVDTLGKNLPDLKDLLTNTYPEFTFNLLNFGQGSTDLESGLKRLTEGTLYMNNYMSPVLSNKPDILIIESFAYNHWTNSPSDLDRQWVTYAKMIDTVREKSPDTRVIFAATIAPNSARYGDGKLNWSTAMKRDAAATTQAYLENLVKFTASQKAILADAYHPSLTSAGEGNLVYIDASDHLHPSQAGARLFSEKIVETIKMNQLFP